MFSIDKNEFRKLLENAGEMTSSSQNLTISELDANGKSPSQYGRFERRINNENDWESTGYGRTLYGTTAVTRDVFHDAPVHTSNSQETNQYLQRSGIRICTEREPKLIRRTLTERPVTYEERVFVRYLRPPALPPSGVMKYIIYKSNLTHVFMILGTHYQRSASRTATSSSTTCHTGTSANSSHSTSTCLT